MSTLFPERERAMCLPLTSNCLWACNLDLRMGGLSPELPTQLPTVPTSSGPRGCCWGQNEGAKTTPVTMTMLVMAIQARVSRGEGTEEGWRDKLRRMPGPGRHVRCGRCACLCLPPRHPSFSMTPCWLCLFTYLCLPSGTGTSWPVLITSRP